MKILFKLLIILLITNISERAISQTKNDLEKALNGDYIPNNQADSYLGNWQSLDGNYTFNLDKKTVQVKGGKFNFKTDKLVFKLIKVKDTARRNEKVLNKPIFLNIAVGHASTIYEDPVTNNTVNFHLYFRDKDSIELIVTTNLMGDKSKGSYFPERIIFKRVLR